jgi:hypothetical protein
MDSTTGTKVIVDLHDYVGLRKKKLILEHPRFEEPLPFASDSTPQGGGYSCSAS